MTLGMKDQLVVVLVRKQTKHSKLKLMTTEHIKMTATSGH